MKVSLLLVIALVLLFNADTLQSQFANNNMYLLSNINSHSTLGLYSAVWGYKAPDGREYAILGSYDGTSFVDITDPLNIYEVDFVGTTNVSSSSNVWREMKTYSHYAYIVSEVPNSGVQIVDLQYLPDSVRYVKKFVPAGHTSSHSISQFGPYLYLNGCNSTFGQGVTVLDLTVDPETPIKRGGFNANYIHDCRVVNDTIYAANINNSRVTIIDATNKNLLTQITNFTNLPNSGPHNTALTPDGNYLLVTDEIGNSPRLMKFWNVSDFGNITYVASWQPTGITGSIVHNVEVYGNYALVAHYSAGIRLVDITNPAVPVEVAWYDSYSSNNGSSYNGCWGVYMFPSGKIIASDRQTGLYVLKTHFNLTMAIEGLYNPSTNRMNKKDSVTVYLRNAKAPYTIVDSAKSTIDSVTLTGSFRMNYAPVGEYYMTVKHRSSLETWSKIGGEDYDPMTMESYNFVTSASQAFGNNMIQVDASPVRFALYSGDVNQDGSIDGGDASIVDNDVSNFVFGNVVTDLNGDYVVDGTDMSVVDNNAFNFVTRIVP